MAATNINRSVDHKLMKEKMKKDAESDEDEQTGGGAPEDDRRKRLASAMKKASGAGGSGAAGGGGDSSMKSCQAENCAADLTDAKTYHRRHKVCEVHAKAQVVVVAGIRQRFCQQCSRFHELSEFDEAKRSCRRRLAGHNERRRKNPSGNPSNGQLMKDMVCGQVDDRGRIQITVQENANYKHFHVL